MQDRSWWYRSPILYQGLRIHQHAISSTESLTSIRLGLWVVFILYMDKYSIRCNEIEKHWPNTVLQPLHFNQSIRLVSLERVHIALIPTYHIPCVFRFVPSHTLLARNITIRYVSIHTLGRFYTDAATIFRCRITENAQLCFLQQRDDVKFSALLQI